MIKRQCNNDAGVFSIACSLLPISLFHFELSIKRFDVAQEKAALSAGSSLAGEAARIGVAAHRRAADAQQNRGFVERKLRIAKAFEQLLAGFGFETHPFFGIGRFVVIFWRFERHAARAALGRGHKRARGGGAERRRKGVSGSRHRKGRRRFHEKSFHVRLGKNFALSIALFDEHRVAKREKTIVVFNGVGIRGVNCGEAAFRTIFAISHFLLDQNGD